MTVQEQFVPHTEYTEYLANQMKKRAHSFYKDLKRRRTVREFSNRGIPEEVIEDCLLAAGTAPNGANMQPWHFVVVQNPEIKSTIRVEAEKEEEEFYERRASEEWLKA